MNESQPNGTLPRLIGLFGGIIAFFVILLFDLDPGNPAVTRTAAVAALMAVWWITEAVPLAVTALLPVVLFPLLGVQNGKAVSSSYFNWVIFLFIGGFLVALAMQRWNLHKRIALGILLRFGSRPRNIMLGFMAATAFLSMWVSNTATTMMMVPIALAIILKMEDVAGREKTSLYSAGLLLAIAYSASIGGIATLVGTPPNLALAGIYSQEFAGPTSPDITFANWLLYGVPLSILLFILAAAYLFFFFGRHCGFKSLEKDVLRKQYQELGPMQFEEKVVLVVFTSLALLWLTRSGLDLGTVQIPGWSKLFAEPSFINDGTVAMAMAVILFLIPAKQSGAARILDANVFQNLPWGIVLLFGGGFALASGFEASGLSQWIGQQLEGLGALPPLLLILLLCLIVTFLTELTSNTASAQILLPILANLALAIDMNPLMLMIPGTVSCSCAFMLPVATPPNAIVFGAERIRMAQMVRTGLFLNVAGAVVVAVVSYFLGSKVFNY